MSKWVESVTWPGFGHLEPFHDNENELIPSWIGEAIDEHINRLEADNAVLIEALGSSLDSLNFSSRDLIAQVHIPPEDSRILQDRIDQARDTIAKAKGERDERRKLQKGH